METRTNSRNILSGVAATLGANATVFAASACVMLVELVAGRIISRHLGMSLYTWTSIIGVIMAGISLGNWQGGRLADRRTAAPLLAVLFLLSAAGCAAILPLNGFFGTFGPLRALPWTARIFVHVTLVFFGPSFLLGMVNPVVAKLALDMQNKAGRAVGGVFAWGAAGSILGTFAAGFVLVPLFPASRILLVAAGGLVLLGMIFVAAALLRRGVILPGRIAEEISPGPSCLPAAALGDNERPRLSRAAWWMAVATVLASNAAFMAYELAVSRIISRTFGSSLYTWTTVIGVVLAGICLGNWLGGRIADRWSGRRAVATVFLLSAVAVGCTPWLNRLMAEGRGDVYALAILSWPMQILAHTLAAFVPPCVFIGMVSPIVIRRLLDLGFAPGRTVGAIYAWGAVGGIVGTFLAGYLLIAWLGALPLAALVALLLAVTALLWRPRWWTVAGTILAAAALVVSMLPASATGRLATITGLRMPAEPGTIYEKESQYSYIAVTADPVVPELRQMTLDKLIHSKVDLRDPSQVLYPYEQIYTVVINKRFPAPQPLRALVIGGGGYAGPHYLEVTRPGSHIVVAEIDPAVTEAAHAAFGLPRDTKIEIHNVDARALVTDLAASKDAKFDCIFGDSFNDFTVPHHLISAEFTGMVAGLLQDDGLYMLNMIDIFNSGAFLSAMVETCRSVFPQVAVLNTGKSPDSRDTFVLVCAKRPIVLEDVPMRLMTQFGVGSMLLPEASLQGLLARHGGRRLTDDYAPVENLLAPVVRAHSMDQGSVGMAFARAALRKGDRRGAVDYACRALAHHPNWSEALSFLARLAADPKGGAEARKAIAQAGESGALPKEVVQAVFDAVQSAAQSKK